MNLFKISDLPKHNITIINNYEIIDMRNTETLF